MCSADEKEKCVSTGLSAHIEKISLSLMKKNRRGRGETFADLHVPERDLNDAGTRRVEVGNSRGSKGGGGEVVSGRLLIKADIHLEKELRTEQAPENV